MSLLPYITFLGLPASRGLSKLLRKLSYEEGATNARNLIYIVHSLSSDFNKLSYSMTHVSMSTAFV